MTPENNIGGQKHGLLISALMFTCLIAVAAGTEGRNWEGEDSIGVRYIAPQTGDGNPAAFESRSVIAPSPNGDRFLFVTVRGDLKSNARVGELHIFQTKEVSAALARGQVRPTESKLIKFSSTWGDSDHEPIGPAIWESPDTILFLGTEGAKSKGIYRLNLANGELLRLTKEGHQVVDNALANFNQETLVTYMALDTTRPPPAPKADVRTIIPVTDLALAPLVGIKDRPDWAANPPQLFLTSGKPALASGANLAIVAIWISPNGKLAVTVAADRHAAGPTDLWGRYEARPSASAFQFMILDLESGAVRTILNSPTGAGATRVGGAAKLGANGNTVNVLWSADSSHVILVNTALPLTENIAERVRMSYVVDYAIGDDRLTVIEPLRAASGDAIQQIGWLKRGLQFLITYKTSDGAPGSGRLYDFAKCGWTGQTISSAESLSRAKPVLTDGISIALQEDENTPPTLIASDDKGHKLDLLGPDPALTGVRIAQMQSVQWKGPFGETETGGLMMPPQHSNSVPAPLIVQVYHYKPQQFYPDGVNPSAESAQALAARGFAVLYMEAFDQLGKYGIATSLQEKKFFRDNLDAAVGELSGRGLVDNQQVGLVGFSRGGYLIHYALTHPGRTRISAAVIDDSHIGAYEEYIYKAAIYGGDSDESNAVVRGEEAEFGGQSFWTDKTTWVNEASLFNVEKVTTPTLFSISGYNNGTKAVLVVAESVAAWRLNRKPFEYLLLPYAEHILRLPGDLFSLRSATIDWICFWMQGREEGSATKAEQYERWRKIRAKWQEQQSWEAAGNPVGSKPKRVTVDDKPINAAKQNDQATRN